MTTNPKKSEVRLSKKALFGGLGYTPHPGQWQVHRSKAPRRVVACGVRFGKSTLAVHEAITELLKPREQALGWLIGPTYELTNRIFDRVVAILHDRFPRRVLSYDERGHRIVVANFGGGRSALRARSADRPAGLLGEALDFLIVDECTEIRDDTWDGYIAPRLVDRRGTALLLSTPTTVQSWFYKQFRRAKHDPEYAAFRLPTVTNPHIDADAIETERTRLQPDDFRSQYLAEFIGLDTTPCKTCGGPAVRARVGIHLHGAELPHYCPDCGLLVHEDGTTAVGIEGWMGEDRLTCSVTIWSDDSTHGDVQLPDYCRRVLTFEDRPENPEPLDHVGYHKMVIHPPCDNPQELPPGCD